MLKKIKELAGMEKVVLETLAVMIFMSVAYLIAYWMSGDVKIAVIAAAFTAFAVCAVAPSAETTSFAFAVCVVATVAAIPPFAITIPVIAIIALFAVVAVFFAADDHKVKCWKVLLVVSVETYLLFVAFSLCVPYLAIVLLAVAVVALSVILLRKKTPTSDEGKNATAP